MDYKKAREFGLLTDRSAGILPAAALPYSRRERVFRYPSRFRPLRAGCPRSGLSSTLQSHS